MSPGTPWAMDVLNAERERLLRLLAIADAENHMLHDQLRRSETAVDLVVHRNQELMRELQALKEIVISVEDAPAPPPWAPGRYLAAGGIVAA